MIPVPFQDEIVQVSRALNEINLQHVFVGGAVAPLLITDQGASHIRPTDDIDAVVRVASCCSYHVGLSEKRKVASVNSMFVENLHMPV